MEIVKSPATLDDLYAAPNEGTYELVNGELVFMAPTGFSSARVATNIVVALHAYERVRGAGLALADGIAYVVNLHNRRSFSPDTSYTLIVPPPERKMKFIDGAPIFAAEVRSEHDYGLRADRAYAEKRRDYFAAGTSVVWNVDPVAARVRSYRHDWPDFPTVFHVGEMAAAEPALPGWTVAVADLFV